MSVTTVVRPWWNDSLPMQITGHNKKVVAVAIKMLQISNPTYIRGISVGPDRLVPQYIVEVGACIGYYAILWHEAWPGADLLLIEPSTWNFQYLLENTKHIEGVTYLKGAASDEPGEVEIGLSFGRADPEKSPTGRISVYGHHKVYKEVVPAYRLDDIVDRKVDILHMDVEGHEMKVLMGAERILTEDRPVCLVEVHEKNLDMVDWAKEDLVYYMYDLGYEKKGKWGSDSIFWPK